jgi:hypothetical protein
MGLHIDTSSDLRKLLKQLKLEVRSLDELRVLLANINADEDPTRAHQRLAWRHIASVSKVACIVAGVCSFYATIIPSAMMQHHGGDATGITLGILGILWGGAVGVTLIAAVATLAALRSQPANRSRPRQGAESVGSPNATTGNSVTDITIEPTRIAASRNPS